MTFHTRDFSHLKAGKIIRAGEETLVSLDRRWTAMTRSSEVRASALGLGWERLARTVGIMRNSYVSLVPVGLSLLGLAACGSGKSGAGPDLHPAATAGTGGSGAAGAPAQLGGAAGVGVSTCMPGVPATSQVPRMKDAAYNAVMKDLLGVTTVAGDLPSKALAPDYDGSMTAIAWDGYLKTAEKIAADVLAGPNKSRFIACDPAVGTCLTDTIKSFGRKAFRRPLTPAEVASFERFKNVTPAGTPAELAETILFAFLASPSFILLPELSAEKSLDGAANKLTSFEVATRLSFLLWGSVPDDELNTAADNDQLGTQEQIAAQAQRMLKSDKVAPAVARFHQAYLGIETSSHWLNNREHDPKFTKFTAATYSPLLAEMDSFFEELVLKGGTLNDLFLSNVGFVTHDTAALYGLDPAAYGSEPARVELDPKQRPGFLTRAGFLSTFSNYGTTSPILRGAFISGRILGIHPGEPSPDALKKPIPDGVYTTRRQQIEALTGVAPCKACHAQFINPAGFVLERYDAIGSWQDTDQLSGPIDGTADVFLGPGQLKTISSPLDMMKELAALGSVQRHYAEQFVTFATGRAPNPNDACAVDKLATKLAQANYPVLNLMADYTETDSFRLRTVGP